MSNDTDYHLRFVCPTREMLEHVMTYLQRKKARWDAWSQRGNDSERLMERTGATSAGKLLQAIPVISTKTLLPLKELAGASIAIIRSMRKSSQANTIVTGESWQLM